MYQSSFMDNSALELSFMDHRHDSSEFELGVVMDGSVTHSFSQTVSTELPSVDYNDFEFFMFYTSLYQSFLNNCESELSFFDNSKVDLLLTNNDESFTATELTPGGGGTRIWKWRTSAYRRTKIGGIRCKISSRKGGHSVWVPKKWGLFWCGLPKWGSFSVQKCNFKAKFANFLLKLPQNRYIAQNARKACKKFALFM